MIAAIGDIVIYILGVNIAAAAQYQTKLVFKPGKLRDIGSFFLASFENSQSKLEARIIARNITLYKAGDKLWGYIVIGNCLRAGLGYNDQRLSIA